MKRKLLNVFLFIIFLLVMSFHFLPRIWHEIFGIMMTAAVAAHLFINRRQFFYSLRGKKTARKIFSLLINFLMPIIFLIIMVTGIFISNYLFHDLIPLEIRRNFFMHQLHVSLPYVLMIFVGCHLGLHWREIKGKFFSFMTNSLVNKILAVLIVCTGIYGSFMDQVGDRILMKHIFATPATDFPFPIFLVLTFAIIGMYAVITFYIDETFK